MSELFESIGVNAVSVGVAVLLLTVPAYLLASIGRRDARELPVPSW